MKVENVTIIQEKSYHLPKELKCIYKEHGIPERLQSDNESEFKKHVKKCCEKNKMKICRRLKSGQ